MNAPLLNRAEMMDYLTSIMSPVEGQHSEKEIDERQFVFCLNCPDPIGALYLLFDAPQDVSLEALLDEALSMPNRDVSSWGEESLALDHPLRTWKLAE